jgi:hypothetical protein
MRYNLPVLFLIKVIGIDKNMINTPIIHLYERLTAQASLWCAQGYPNADYQVIGEILEWAKDPEGSGFRLRSPQVRALETYWYLRLIENTAHIVDLYKKVFPKQSELLPALGLVHEDIKSCVLDYGIDKLFDRIKTEDEFVSQYKLEALRETLNLDYPSYILALAMGAGKTVLIGAIIATEFAMALEYPQGPFVQNALVFAPGKTIIESLRELAEIPYHRILPPRLYKPFSASVKLIFTRDGEKDIPVIRGSFFNVIVTNTEKIRIQKETIRKSDLDFFFSPDKEEEAKQEVANLRLRAIASLPHLAVFSDEAHHTYGQSLGNELKKVRKTVDYLADQTNVVCVVNTTGTPYYQRQPLRDVVIWYGLSEGIRDGILKEIAGSIQAFDFEGNEETYVAHVIEDFFKDYGNVTLPDGTPAKLAIYFPQTDDIERLRPSIEKKLMELGLPITLLLEHHTRHENKADFDRFKFKDSFHRVALLVDRGVEGWDVPALFACALVRKLKSSNNFVLQASCRCLRQIPGNAHKARIYLSMDNRSILDRQLQETYGETIADLNHAETNRRSSKICLRKLNLPPLVVKQIIRHVVKKETASTPLKLAKPKIKKDVTLTKSIYTIAEQETTSSLLQMMGNPIEITSYPDDAGIYSVAVELAATYRLMLWEVYEELQRLYGDGKTVPLVHMPELARQIEEQTRNYEVKEETIEKALALVKLEGFNKELDADGTEIYTADISYPIDRERLLARWEDWKAKVGEYGFHYTPYNFDSTPESNFFEQMLQHIRLRPDKVSDIYFTGALTDPQKTDFYIEYKGEDGKSHRYTPDFIIRRKDGKCLIVEIKDARFEATTQEDLERNKRGESAISIEGRKAVALKKWERLNPKKLQYEIIFAGSDAISFDKIKNSRTFIEGNGE